MADSKRIPSRRGLLKLLTAVGIPGPLALSLLAQSRPKITVENMKQASPILGDNFTDERLNAVRPALQRNLDQYQALRDFVIDDSVEPAPVFLPRRMETSRG